MKNKFFIAASLLMLAILLLSTPMPSQAQGGSAIAGLARQLRQNGMPPLSGVVELVHVARGQTNIRASPTDVGEGVILLRQPPAELNSASVRVQEYNSCTNGALARELYSFASRQRS